MSGSQSLETEGASPKRPRAVYAVVALQVLVGILMILGFQGLFILGPGGSTDGFNLGFPLGIINLILIAGTLLGRPWGRSSVLAFAVVGIVASVLGSVQAYLNNMVSTATTVGPDLPIIPLIVEAAILYLLMNPQTKEYFKRKRVARLDSNL